MGVVAGQVELLSESPQTRVVRLHLDHGRSVICKEALGPGAEERVSHESAILHRLAGAPHVVPLAAEQPDPRALVFEDVHGKPAAQVALPLDPSRMMAILLELANAVAAVHERGVVHGDINPGNILLVDGGALYLIDFALATTFAEIRPEFTHPREIVGTLPYLAPEQTGRTGRGMDRRADLYGLGATMYELVTGRPPFGTGDPIRLIHDHLARPAVPPSRVNQALPPGVSEIIMHLLEKEPDNRYQTAEGVARDLQRVRDGVRNLRVGEDDAPLRLSAPSHLAGREHEIEVLRSAFEATLSGQSRGVVISGPSGVGKSALLDELRPIVTGVDGWFASGRFDRYHQDQEHDGVGLALRGLGRLLLAEPEEELAEIRERLLRGLGSNAGLAAAVLPEFATLLGVRPDRGDPMTNEVRATRAALEILRAVAAGNRPVAFVIDDIQWSGATPLGLLDQLLRGEEEIPGLLTVAAYRDEGIDDSHLLAPVVARWRRQPGKPVLLPVRNLGEADLAVMVGEMLHAPAEAPALASAIYGVTRGNPYETVELLNGLRREGVLRPTHSGWRWDPSGLRQRLARENMTEFARARVDAMPPATRQTLEAMACLGGEVDSRVLAIATGLSEATVAQRLPPALEDGLLVVVARGRGLRFHHDRLRDVVLSGLAPPRLRAMRLRMARRLAARPELFAVAADQYLAVADTLTDPAERGRAAALFRQAADQRMLIGESRPAEQLLDAAVRLTEDPETLIELHTARHTALFRLGRLDEADGVYALICRLSRTPYDRVAASRVQISSLTNRNRPEEAIGLGLELLEELGWTTPLPEQVNVEIEKQVDWCTFWIDATSEAEDLQRPDVEDRLVLAAGALLSRMMPACFFRDQVTMAWLALSAARCWAEKGPTRTLLGVVAHLPWVLIPRRQAYRSAQRVMRRLLTVGDERNYEPYTSQVRFLYALGLIHWSQPLEQEADEGRRAREGLVRGGDLQSAGYTFCSPVYEIDLASTLDEYAAEVDAALAFAERTGNQHAAGLFVPYRWLVAALRGESAAADGATMTDRLGGEPVATANANAVRALAAALRDDQTALARFSAAAMEQCSAVEATYVVWQAHLLRAIALAHRVRTAPEQGTDLAELNEIIDWMAARAADAPTNFRHMLRLVEAERAWALRDFGTAIHAFDSALRDAGHRPWHRAYISERSARFMLAHGLERSGWALLIEAREAYRLWGAWGKVDQLDRAYPTLDRPTESAANLTRRSSITSGTIDMLGILDASRALSSETTVGALRSKVVEVLSAMTGATDVGIVVWHVEQRQWRAATDEGDLVPIDEHHRAPESVIRYVERTSEPLIIGDATRDDRFARDEYFAGLDVCSVLAVPVLSRGELRAILLLENRLIRDAFSVERLEAVRLVAGQLAVSLENALLYSSLESKVAERTQQLAFANERLERLSITDPLTGLANRRRLEEVLRNEWQRVRRTHSPLSVAMVDIDNFKRYNDRHGHQEGDRCLRRVATEIERIVRETDLVARYGGEEFAVVMPDTEAAAAREAAERVRVGISALAEPLNDDQVVTASIGVATLHDADRETIDQVLGRADTALYQAKRAGRNRVRSADLPQ